MESSRASSTLQGYRNKALRMIQYFIAHKIPCPPAPIDVGRFLATANADHQNASAAQHYTEAFSFIARLNAWDLNQYATLLVTAPVEASRRLFPSAPVKSLPLQAGFVRPIVRAYVFGSAASNYSCIIGAALAAGSVLATRYNDVMQLRLHPDYAEWGLDQASGLHFLEFFLAHRKNVLRPSFLKLVDDPEDPYCAFQAVKAAFKRVPLLDRLIPAHLNRLLSDGSPSWERPCCLDTWTGIIRSALHFAEVPESEIASFTSHALRRGWGTDSVQANLPPAAVRIGANIQDADSWQSDYYHQSTSDLARSRRILPWA